MQCECGRLSLSQFTLLFLFAITIPLIFISSMYTYLLFTAYMPFAVFCFVHDSFTMGNKINGSERESKAC